MRNHYAAEVVRFQPYENGDGWYYDDGNVHHSCSDEGRAQLAELAVTFDQHSETLSAFMDVVGQTRCAHNRPLSDLEWHINTYLDGCPGVPWPWFILSGFHWELDPVVHGRDSLYCLPFEYWGGIFMRTDDAA